MSSHSDILELYAWCARFLLLLPQSSPILMLSDTVLTKEEQDPSQSVEKLSLFVNDAFGLASYW